ncbi:MAG: response regulator, partial [Planctomycetes bacterium]|nr:response regulator [Planctomycetota bacterium]
MERQKRTKRILVVDDSRTVLKILSKGLESLGYEVITAEDGQEAQEVLEDISFDLVLTDLNMPRVDGFELIEYLRSRPSWKDLPIVVLTSKGDKESMRRALDLGANIYLNKPAPLPKLRYK